jgi:acetyl esterase/lipase
MVALTFHHRLPTDDNVAEASADLADALAFVRRRAADLRADPNRVCLAFYSAGGVVAGALLHDAPNYIKCVVLYYPYLDLEHLRNKTIFRDAHPAAHVDSLAGYSPRDALAHPKSSLPPLLLARAGHDEIPHLNESVDRFVGAALANNVRIDLYTHPDGVHGFDLRTRDARTREIIAQTLSFFRRHLFPPSE